MTKLIQLLPTADVPSDVAKEVVADGRIFAVFNAAGQVYAIDGICAHAGGPLGEGSLNGHIVTCPWHGWQYDITSGRHCLNDAICQTSFPVTIRDGHVWVEVPDDVSTQES